MNDNEKMQSDDLKTAEKSIPQTIRTKKKRFTVLDFGFVVILLLAIIGIGFRTVIADWIVKTAPQEMVTVSFKAENLSFEVASKLKENDVLLMDGAPFATLLSFTAEKSRINIEQKDENGVASFVEVEDPNSFTVVGVLAVNGHYTDEGFVCRDDMNLHVGKMLSISAPTYSITVKITEIPRK